MKTLDLADVSRLPEELKSGEEIELRDGGRAVAKVVPLEKPEESIEEIIAQAKTRENFGKLPEDFFTRPRPRAAKSVLEALLEERHGEARSGEGRVANSQRLEERIDELARQGKVRKGTGTLPDDFFTRPLPEAESSVLEQLLEDRRTGR